MNRLNYADYLFDRENNLKIKVKFNDLIGKAIIRYGCYEPRSLQLAIEILKAHPGIFIDVGANIGLYSIYCSKICDVKTIAIEGSPEAFIYLQENINRNHLSGQIEPYLCVLSSDAEFVKFGYHHRGNLGSSRIANQPVFRGDRLFFTHSVRLDDVLEHLDLEHQAIALLKMDIEGHEYPVLKASTLIQKYSPSFILLECITSTSAKNRLLELLSNRDYEAYSVDKKPFTLDSDLPEHNLLFVKIGKK